MVYHWLYADIHLSKKYIRKLQSVQYCATDQSSAHLGWVVAGWLDQIQANVIIWCQLW